MMTGTSSTSKVGSTLQPIAHLSGVIVAGSVVEVFNKHTSLTYHDIVIPGVAYSFFTVADPLQNTRQCQIDAGLIKEIGANTVRVYRVDGNANHDGCMQAFASQGIYVWVDLPSPGMSIQRVRKPRDSSRHGAHYNGHNHQHD